MNDYQQGPAYVPRAAEEAWTAPSDFQNVNLYGFVVKADRSLLDEVLERYIDRPSQELGYRVAVDTVYDHVLFLFVDSERAQPRLQTATGTTGSPGSHSEQMFAVVVFGTETRPHPGPIAFAPYVYATSPPGWRTEREIFGYPQQLAKIRIEPDEKDSSKLPACLDVCALAIKKFRPDSMATPRTIIRLTKKPGAKDDPCSEDQLVRAIIAAVTGSPAPGAAVTVSTASVRDVPQPVRRRRSRSLRAPAPRSTRGRFGVTAADVEFFKRWHCEAPDQDAYEADEEETDTPSRRAVRGDTDRPEVDLESSLKNGVRMLFLKQFRDIAFADRACFQAIVEAVLTANGCSQASISHDYELILKKLDSAPLCRELGVKGGKSDVALAFRMKFNSISIGGLTRPPAVVSNPFWNPAVETTSPDERPRLPKYVERGADAVWRQPSMLFGARIYGFGVKVDVKQQAEVLDKYVNNIANRCDVCYGPDKFRLTPCQGLDMVMLMFVDYRRVASGTDDDSRLGGVSYREFLVTQLAFFQDDQFPELNWLIPFIYLDQDSPRLGGREIYGYPKQLGEIPEFDRFTNQGLRLEAAQTLELQSTVIHQPRDRKAESQTIVKVSGGTVPDTLKQYDDASDMIVDLLSLSAPSVQQGLEPSRLFPATGRGLGVDVVRALLSGGVGHVFLKQFRDCADPAVPCYQAICKTDTVPGKFRGGARVSHEGYRITIENNESERLLEYLGLPTNSRSEITPAFAYWMDLDVELTTGRVIANSFERAFVADRSTSARYERGAKRTIRRTGELAL